MELRATFDVEGKGYAVVHEPLPEKAVVDLTTIPEHLQRQKDIAEQKMADTEDVAAFEQWSMIAKEALKNIVKLQIDAYKEYAIRLETTDGEISNPDLATKVHAVMAMLGVNIPDEKTVKN